MSPQKIRSYSLFPLLLCALLVILTADEVHPSVRAQGSWTVDSTISCSQGYSVLNWSGYGQSSNGTTNGSLWRWTGASWQLVSSGWSGASGASGSTPVSNPVSPTGNWYTETGGHSATFISEPVYTASDVNFCD